MSLDPIIETDSEGNLTIQIGHVGKTLPAEEWLRMALRKTPPKGRFHSGGATALETRIQAGQQYMHGWDVRDIAEYHGVSMRTVHRWMRQQGLRREEPGIKAKLKEKDEAMRLIADGLTRDQAAKKVGVHPSTVSHWLQGMA